MATGRRPLLRVLQCDGWDILRQLRAEEALFRADKGNWLLINKGPSRRAIVMGISGKADELVHVAEASREGVPLIRRFTGGGTVVLDSDSLMVSFVMNGEVAGGHALGPHSIMDWSGDVYDPVFRGSERHTAHAFAINAQDYAFGPRKVGGNAQGISKGRFVHHTSFLWDYDPRNMALLKHPAKQPSYREGRDHAQFVTSLREATTLASPDDMLARLYRSLRRGHELQWTDLRSLERPLAQEHRKATHVVGE